MWAAIIAVFATYRVTQLVVEDRITEPAREWLLGWLRNRRSRFAAWVHDLITCVFCVSVWVSLAVTVSAYVAGVVESGDATWWWFPVMWMALAGAYSVLRAATEALWTIAGST